MGAGGLVGPSNARKRFSESDFESCDASSSEAATVALAAVEEITEIESGKRNSRPELQRAICRAKVSGRA